MQVERRCQLAVGGPARQVQRCGDLGCCGFLRGVGIEVVPGGDGIDQVDHRTVETCSDVGQQFLLCSDQTNLVMTVHPACIEHGDDRGTGRVRRNAVDGPEPVATPREGGYVGVGRPGLQLECVDQRTVVHGSIVSHGCDKNRRCDRAKRH